jgi:transglutaminase-like putative cysteine protease
MLDLLLSLAFLQPSAPPPVQPPPAIVAPAPATTAERWYEVSLAGKHAGHQHEEIVTAADTITTRQRVLLVIKRGTTEVRNAVESEVVESRDHKVRTMRSRTELGGKPIVSEYVFGDDGVKVTRVQDGSRLQTNEKIPVGDWLTPAAARAFVAARQTAGAKTFSVTTLDPAGGLEPSTDAYTFVEKTTLDVGGRKIAAWKYSVMAGKPKDLVQTMWLDEKAETIRLEIDLGGTPLVTTAASRERALRPTESPEIMVSTFVKPTGKADALRDARRVRKAEYVLSVPAGGGGLPDLPSTGTQTVTRIDAASARVAVDIAATHPAATGDDDGALTPSAWVNSEDTEIVALTNSALAGVAKDADAAKKAEAVRAFVHRHITSKNLGSGFATASEVARTRSGDCTEHALLTAAMLRAAGIPSRVASGLVFADQFAGERRVFAYHMWTQALLGVGKEARWVDLDATLPGQAFDATHLALVVSTLKDGQFEASMAPISTMLGRLGVEVVKVE